MKPRGFFLFVVVVMAAVAAMIVPISPQSAQAHPVSYGWWDCTQIQRLNNGPLRVGVVSLPADGWGDGVQNSFFGRVADATSRLNTVLAAANYTGNGLVWVGQTSATNTANIAFRQEYLPSGTYGFAYVSDYCRNVHGSSVLQLPGTVYLATAVRSDWFTQDDTRRAYWEGCPGSSYAGSYTCSKTMDFGSTALHEIGHAVGIPHPRSVSEHTATWGAGSAWDLGACTNALDQATLCQSGDAGAGTHRTHRRTLHSWDVQSINLLY